MLSPGNYKQGLSLLLLLGTCWHSHALSQETRVLGPALPLAHRGQVPTPLTLVSFSV